MNKVSFIIFDINIKGKFHGMQFMSFGNKSTVLIGVFKKFIPIILNYMVEVKNLIQELL